MSDDIAERLRRRMAWWKDDCEDLREAADEITRLRAALDAEKDRGGIITQAAQEVTNALRTENERLRSALGNFASKEPVQLTCDGGGFIQALIVFDNDLSTARALLGNGANKAGAGNE